MEQITWTKVERGILKSNTGKYRARITKTLPDGKTIKQFCRDARTLDDARAYRKELKEEFKGVKTGDNADLIQNKIKGRRMRFRELAQIFEEKKLTAPVYDDEDSDDRRKQKGLVRFEDSKRFLNILISRFGGMMIRDITHGDLEKFKLSRLKEPKLRGGGRRKISSVHRELEIMRSVLAYGATKGFLEVSPFKGDDNDAPLINKNHEKKRDRILSFPDEASLRNDLTSAPNSPVLADREHLWRVLVFSIDTAVRHNELQQLERRDIDLDSGVHGEINIRLRITKTEEARTVPIFTPRLRQLLEQKLAEITDDPHALVFGKICIKKSFAAAKQRVGIKDFTIHDCRHTAISRWIDAGVSAEEAMKYAGIKSHAVFQRYLALSRTAHKKNTERIGAYYAEHLITTETTTTASEAVN